MTLFTSFKVFMRHLICLVVSHLSCRPTHYVTNTPHLNYSCHVVTQCISAVHIDKGLLLLGSLYMYGGECGRAILCCLCTSQRRWLAMRREVETLFKVITIVYEQALLLLECVMRHGVPTLGRLIQSEWPLREKEWIENTGKLLLWWRVLSISWK